MKIISQRNSLWANAPIGKSSLRVGRWGCTITSLSMLTSWAGQWVTPPVIAAKPWFNNKGEIIWAKIDIPHLKFDRRVIGYSETYLKEVTASKDAAALVEVDHSHWVVPIRKVLNTWLIADPWTGTKRLMWPTYKEITKIVVFNRK